MNRNGNAPHRLVIYIPRAPNSGSGAGSCDGHGLTSRCHSPDDWRPSLGAENRYSPFTPLLCLCWWWWWWFASWGMCRLDRVRVLLGEEKRAVLKVLVCVLCMCMMCGWCCVCVLSPQPTTEAAKLLFSLLRGQAHLKNK